MSIYTNNPLVPVLTSHAQTRLRSLKFTMFLSTLNLVHTEQWKSGLVILVRCAYILDLDDLFSANLASS